MKKPSLLLLLFMIAILFLSCKKDSIALTPARLILGKWKMVSSITSVGLQYPSGCNIDDVTEFSVGNQAIFSEGNIKCDPNNPYSSWDYYTIDEAGKTLEFLYANKTYTILELTSTTLKCKVSSLITLNFTKI